MRTQEQGTKRILISVIMMMCSASIAQILGQTNAPRIIPEKQAQNLLRAYLRSQGYDKKDAPLDIELERGVNADPTFYLYDVYVDTPQRLVAIGAYGVNRKTADIWERIGCRRIESEAVATSQKKIRETSGLSHSELDKLRNAGPCFGGLEAEQCSPRNSGRMQSCTLVILCIAKIPSEPRIARF